MSFSRKYTSTELSELFRDTGIREVIEENDCRNVYSMSFFVEALTDCSAECTKKALMTVVHQSTEHWLDLSRIERTLTESGLLSSQALGTKQKS